jgi:hypothetical protein
LFGFVAFPYQYIAATPVCKAIPQFSVRRARRAPRLPLAAHAARRATLPARRTQHSRSSRPALAACCLPLAAPCAPHTTFITFRANRLPLAAPCAPLVLRFR